MYETWWSFRTVAHPSDERTTNPMKHNRYSSSSRRKTPWDDKEDLSSLEAFIRGEYHDHFDMHHTNHQQNEATLLNSFDIASCRICGSESISKKGLTKNGIQRFYCHTCNHYFTITTGTIFANHKISVSEWIEYLLNLFGYSSLNLNSKVNKNANTTAKYWLKKVFLLLENYQDNIVLEDVVWIDEFYYTVVRKELYYKENGKLPRGLSRNKYCIGVGCDNHHHYYAVVEGKAKTSAPKTLKAFEQHIKPKSKLKHDSEHSHDVLIETLNLSSEVYPTKETKVLEDKDNPMNRINHMCSALRSFLDSHPGFNREELQDYLNLFVFMMIPPKNKLQKVQILLKLALTVPKSIKFREYFKRKTSKAP